MRGVKVTRAEIVDADDRRILIEIMNGEFAGKNIKILDVKEDSFLGGTNGHWHNYAECMYMLKGEAKDYVMENVDTGEKQSYDLKEGDVVFRGPRIIHGGWFKKGSIIIDIAEDTYISGDYNDVPEEETR